MIRFHPLSRTGLPQFQYLLFEHRQKSSDAEQCIAAVETPRHYLVLGAMQIITYSFEQSRELASFRQK